jgi:hypothetical protein
VFDTNLLPPAAILLEKMLSVFKKIDTTASNKQQLAIQFLVD